MTLTPKQKKLNGDKDFFLTSFLIPAKLFSSV